MRAHCGQGFDGVGLPDHVALQRAGTEPCRSSIFEVGQLGELPSTSRVARSAPNPMVETEAGAGGAPRARRSPLARPPSPDKISERRLTPVRANRSSGPSWIHSAIWPRSLPPALAGQRGGVQGVVDKFHHRVGRRSIVGKERGGDLGIDPFPNHDPSGSPLHTWQAWFTPEPRSRAPGCGGFPSCAILVVAVNPGVRPCLAGLSLALMPLLLAGCGSGSAVAGRQRLSWASSASWWRVG